MRQVGVVKRYIRVLLINIGAHGQKLVDKVEMAFRRHYMRSKCPRSLWWGGEER
jgi:hypothetical protein